MITNNVQNKNKLVKEKVTTQEAKSQNHIEQ